MGGPATGLWRRVLGPALSAALALVMALGATAAAQAHVRSESHSVWEINRTNVDLIMTIPTIESQRLSPAGGQPTDAALERYLAARVYPVADGRPCPLSPPIEVLSAAAGYRKLDFTFRCPAGKTLAIHSAAFIDLAPSHTNFAQVQNIETSEFVEELLTRDRQDVQIIGGQESRLKTASFVEFIGMGVTHIWTGVDHMSFLLGLVLISRRLRDLVSVVTGFTIGHSLTLALAVTGVLRPHAEYIDALVALTIALIGAENVASSTGRSKTMAAATAGLLGLMALGQLLGIGGLPSLLLLGTGLFMANYLLVSGSLKDAGKLRMVITLVFGLIHGFGFAAGLLEMQIPTGRLAELLLGFNLGVEIGQLSLVVGVTLLVALLMRLKLTLPRPIVVEVGGAFLIGLGMFWFISRSYA